MQPQHLGMDLASGSRLKRTRARHGPRPSASVAPLVRTGARSAEANMLDLARMPCCASRTGHSRYNCIPRRGSWCNLTRRDALVYCRARQGGKGDRGEARDEEAREAACVASRLSSRRRSSVGRRYASLKVWRCLRRLFGRVLPHIVPGNPLPLASRGVVVVPWLPLHACNARYDARMHHTKRPTGRNYDGQPCSEVKQWIAPAYAMWGERGCGYEREGMYGSCK
jgi:hypothetical protein